VSHTQAIQAPSCKCHNLAFAFLVAGGRCCFVTLTRYFAICHALDGFDNILGVGNTVNEFLVAGFEELQECPDGDVLEGRVAACDEAVEVAVDAAVGLAPVLDEDGVVADCDISVLLF